MSSSYGLGWGVSQRGGKKMVGLNGLQPPTTTSFVYFPIQGVGAVMLCNAEVATLDGKGDEDLAEPRGRLGLRSCYHFLP